MGFEPVGAPTGISNQGHTHGERSLHLLNNNYLYLVVYLRS